MIIAKQSTARTVTVGPVLDADGVAVTGGVVGDFKISKNGGAPAALDGSATLTHRHTGHYSLALTANDLDTVGQAEVVIDDTVNACPMKEITVVEEAVYDAIFAASALGYVANAPVNVAQISGDSTAADNLETAYDDTAGPVPWHGIIDQGTAQSADATGIVLRAAAAFDDDTLIGCILMVYGSTQGFWQTRVITDNALSGDAVTVDTWNTTPSGTITYKIFAGAPASTSAPAPVNVIQISGDATAADNLESYTDGTTPMPVNVTQVSGDATAADNLEAAADGTGYNLGGGSVVAASVTGNVGGNVTGTIGGMTAAALKDFFDTDSTTTYASAVAGSVVKEIADNAGGAALTVEAIADEVQTRTIAAVTTVTNLTNLPSIPANWLTAAGIAADAGTEIGTAVWATAARTLTAATNITSTGGTVTLDASGRVDVGAVHGVVTTASVGSNFQTFFDNSGLSDADWTIGHVVSHLHTIEASTDDWDNGQRLDLLLDAIKAQTDKLTFNGSNHLYADLRSLWGSATITSSDRAPNL
jgi:hypothetical protein